MTLTGKPENNSRNLDEPRGIGRAPLVRYAWLSVAASIATIALKSTAYFLTGSVGLLSDAIESLVNLIGAGIALAMLTIAARPADEDHPYGHTKAEYFSSGAEGMLILIAAVSIIVTAARRLLHPTSLDSLGPGLVVSALASLINFVVARVLIRAGRKRSSITLEADGQHLMTDVWTSVGVIVGLVAVTLTGWQRLDPILAIAVAVNIVWSGYRLVSRSVHGLIDTALPAAEREVILQALKSYETDGVLFHAVRTRQAATRRFVSMHVLVPGDWTVQRGHELLERIEADIRSKLCDVTVSTHIEPREDPVSMSDIGLDR
jgi:cation diffusion facilitator family transporter